MNKKLVKAYKDTKYKLNGHGARNIHVLKEAFEQVEGALNADIYGKGDIIDAFQNKMANVLGKEEAVFFPSGTMAQQIALRMWCDDRQIYRVAYHPLCHLEIHEQDGLKEIHTIETVLLGQEDRLFDLEDLKAVKEPLAALLIELPQREIGGQLPSFQALKAITDYCQEKNIHTHLDGARLWECAPYYKRTLSELCELFDSVYVSFYKGIGSVAGAILAGSETFAEDSKIWKRRYGGDLISLYPYILTADYYYEMRKERMFKYYEQALTLAAQFNALEDFRTVPLKPVTNMFHVHIDQKCQRHINQIKDVMEVSGIGITPMVVKKESSGYYFEMTIGDSYEKIPKDKLVELFAGLG